MKKVLFVLLAVMFVSSVCFAAVPATPVQETVKGAKVIVGKVASVTVADPAKGIAKGTVVVADETGKATEFTVDGTAKILDAGFNAITLNQIKVGEKVSVESEEGKAEAKAITVKK
ncbi:MAG: hypothetical protein PHE61_07705 [Candidatus Omnitrophica bacterium]|nr:hypothetical protein [Candidatus Omnitrophota bacterium]